MKLVIPAIAVLILAQGVVAQTQGKDSKGENVYRYYDAKKPRIQSGVNEPLQLTFTQFLTISKWVGKKTGDRTVTKEHRAVADLSLLNSKKQLTYLDLGKDKFGGRIEIGYQLSPDTIVGLHRIRGVNSLYFGVFAAEDNALHVSPKDSLIKTIRPRSYGGTFAFNYFMQPNFNDSSLLVFSLGVLVESTWNKSELIPFTQSGNVITTSGAISFKEQDGIFGELSENVLRGRIYASTPYYFGQFCILPYGVLTLRESNVPQYRWGGQFSYTGARPKFIRMSIPSALALGVDWLDDGLSKHSDWNVYLTGSFKL